ncbi:MAG TPA: cyclin-dependent kinase inhibitor 3 family protein [Gammaproteobacteria bacterium]|nr:cyclin-dependent kinase inhibitor 3 family protein [Gammaproteobacteria bacterium]
MSKRVWHTSTSDPLRIDSVAVPGTEAKIGMTLCPGKFQPWGQHGAWRRDLDTDLAAIKDWGASTLITLIEDREFESLSVTALPERARAHGLAWYHWPIADQQLPGQRFEQRWQQAFPAVRQRLEAGEHLVVHCMGGLGRTGIVAARILVEFGTDPKTAVRRIRAARPGAIETAAQLRYVMCRQQR